MNSARIHSILSDEYVRDFCVRNNIVRLAVFGSVLRSDFGPDSDVDMLVEFKPNATPGLYFFDLQEQLAEKIGRPVDLNTPNSLSPYYRDQVLSEAHILYDAA